MVGLNSGLQVVTTALCLTTSWAKPGPVKVIATLMTDMGEEAVTPKHVLSMHHCCSVLKT